ncbi:Calx-beta domain-containing protein [Flavobacterium sp. DG1-102-2]|uniref:Calx-beta domain-containing protein n=1 Tax=Flavobacterium sp. DG1-102-2 TaxID=3081663 RepID=UPI0029491FDC|nr:Calx-beta domain-containing protein [Flavobacterium sp. DG1-102-2]MDV6170159.1 Calx-beta domain-containing protein [Flavobacterium sp. DG1-102-2]
MKRYILKLALLALGTSALVSCDEDTVTYGGQNFVSFDRVSTLRYNAFENIGVSEIPVNLAFPKSNDVVVNFEITNPTGVEGVDFIVLTPGSITIPAGETTGYIRIQIVDNDILNDSKSMDITLTGINDANVALGLLDANSKYKRFLIVNDDCTTNFLPFIAQYNVLDQDDIVIGTAEADVNDNGDCNVLRLTGVLESTFANGTDEGVFVDVTLAPQGTNKNSGTISSVQQLYCVECYNDGDTNNTLIVGVAGTFSNGTVTNPNGVKQLSLNTTIYTASSTSALTSSSVRLRAIN